LKTKTKTKGFSLKQVIRYRDEAFKAKRWSSYQFWRGYAGALIDQLPKPVSEKILDANFDYQSDFFDKATVSTEESQ